MQLGQFIAEFQQFERTMLALLEIIPPARLDWRPFQHESFLKIYSLGELIIHIAQIQEYLFNGLTVNFWDHPHEWSTREALDNRARIESYLQEVAELRARLFEKLTADDLTKLVYLPDRSAATVGELLLRALLHISHHRGQLYGYIHIFTDARLPAITSNNNDYKRLI